MEFDLEEENKEEIVIEVWDYDYLNTDEFLGYLKIPYNEMTINKTKTYNLQKRDKEWVNRFNMSEKKLFESNKLDDDIKGTISLKIIINKNDFNMIEKEEDEEDKEENDFDDNYLFGIPLDIVMKRSHEINSIPNVLISIYNVLLDHG
jgi:hypothetical protein